MPQIRVSELMQDINAILRTDHMSDGQLLPIIQNRYRYHFDTFSWVSRRKDFMLSVVAQVASSSSDTVTVTLDSATVTSAGTPFTSAMTGRQMVIGDEVAPFFITFSSTSVVTLQDGEGTAVLWPRATDTAASWRLFQTIYTLPADAEDIITLGTDIPLVEISGGTDTLNEWDPNRQATDSAPAYWCYYGVSTDTPPRRQIELWPVPTEGRIIRGTYQSGAPTLSATSYVDVPAPLMVYGGLADAFGALFALTGDASYQDRSVFYERKSSEVYNDYAPLELARQSLPTTFGRGGRRSLGDDFYTNHQHLGEFPYP